MQAKLGRYRCLLQERADLQKRDIDLAIEIKVIEKELELSALMAKSGRGIEVSETQEFVSRYSKHLDADHLEFLEVEHRGTRETAEHLGISETQAKRMAKVGPIKSTKVGRAWQFETLSVIKYIIRDKTDEET